MISYQLPFLISGCDLCSRVLIVRRKILTWNRNWIRWHRSTGHPKPAFHQHPKCIRLIRDRRRVQAVIWDCMWFWMRPLTITTVHRRIALASKFYCTIQRKRLVLPITVYSLRQASKHVWWSRLAFPLLRVSFEISIANNDNAFLLTKRI